MNIAIFTESYAPSTGFVPSESFLLAQSYRQLGHRAAVVTCDPKCKKIEARRTVVKVPGKPAPNQYGFAPSKNRKADQAELFSALEAYEFDLVHVFSCGKMAVHGMQFANRFDLPLVLSISDFYEDAIPYLTNTKLLEPWAAFRQKARFRDIADYADMITSTNKKAGDYLASAGIKRKLSLIPINADPERFSRQNADPDQVNAVKMKYHLTDKTVAVFAGRLLYEKGVDILLQRWASHLKLERGLRLLIVGTGPEKAALQQLSKSLNLDKQVIFTGEVMNKDMPAYYAASDLFVSASETPLMSMAVCEALLAGLPCIVSDKSRPAGQLEHGKNGFYFSSSNELTDYVRRIASLDYNGKKALHRMVRSTVEGVSKDAQAQAMLSLYKKAKRLHYYDPQRLEAAKRNGQIGR